MSMISDLISSLEELIEAIKEDEKYLSDNVAEGMVEDVISNRIDIVNDAISTIKELSYNSDWIPVDNTLPENAKEKGALCPRYLVTTEWGVTEGWYNPDVKSWYVLFWFMTTDYEERNIDFDRGTYPKIIKVPDGGKVKITAWRRLSEPYRKEV